MPRVHHLKARKDYPDIGVVKGEMYYKWSIKLQRGGLVRRSKTYPRPSQLNLGFSGQLGDIVQDIGAAQDVDDLRSLAETLRELGSEQQEKYDNMPEGLQQGDTGQLLEERANNCETWADEIEQACDTYDSEVSDVDNMGWEDFDLTEEAEEDEIEQARETKRGEAFEEAKSACENADPF